MRLVILESPYSGDVAKNEKYARRCVRDCLMKGESVIASHLLYTQDGILRDDIPEERMKGIAAGLAWLRVADATVAYCDLGISEGMQQGIDAAEKAGVPVERRTIGKVAPAAAGIDAEIKELKERLSYLRGKKRRDRQRDRRSSPWQKLRAKLRRNGFPPEAVETELKRAFPETKE